MTIFRSKSLDIAGQALGAIGILGFLICGGINMAAQRRLLGHPEFGTSASERPVAIELKGKQLFVEPGYGHRFLLADRFLMPVWLIGAAGILLGNRKSLIERARKIAR